MVNLPIQLLLHEALDFMIPETLDKVLQEQELQAFGEPDIEVLEVEPVSFKAVVPLEPVVDLGDYRSIRVEREPEEITDEQVNDMVEDVDREQAKQQALAWPVYDKVREGLLLN